MTRIRSLLICLLAAVLVIALPEQKWELARGDALPRLPAAPPPQRWTRPMTTAVGRAGKQVGKVGGSAQAAAVAKPRAGRGTLVVTEAVQPRALEHSNGNTTGIADLDLTLAATRAADLMPVTPSLKNGCGVETVLNCGYGSLKRGVLPLNLRRSGAGIALTISHTDIIIEPGGFRFLTSVSF